MARIKSPGCHGGFSGAKIWRVSLSGRDLCLRRWPQAHPSASGLLAIHGLLQHVARAGLDVAPVPLPTRDGETFLVSEEHPWELTPWMPGEANYRNAPSPTKLSNAMQTLARFHQLAISYSYRQQTARVAPSPGLQQRLKLLRDLQQGELERLWKATRAAPASDLCEVALELLDGVARSLDKVTKSLQQIVDVPLPLQWCLRDVRDEHLLFTGEQVTGLIDFGAAAIDSVSGDIARLLGSMAGDHAESWRQAAQAYDQVRPLSQDERRVIAGFDQGGVLCSAANWVRWLFVEERAFSQSRVLLAQLEGLRKRLREIALGWLLALQPCLEAVTTHSP
ncbi:MAG: phosphotransferase [Pirellulales bacterium]|nr:phosphotransferase [Pirellulales bacterium]